MPKSKVRKSMKPTFRKQVIMAGPTLKFVGLYFTKRALEFQKKFSKRKKLNAKETAQCATKNRYTITDVVPWRNPDNTKIRVVMHRK